MPLKLPSTPTNKPQSSPLLAWSSSPSRPRSAAVDEHHGRPPLAWITGTVYLSSPGSGNGHRGQPPLARI
ncbi:hypothetical protein E2562_001885 [Oryza meyeriana var. granulata]|uniref:Uncharacterized protein n=1 Tax=Oryza meyeriana var. granulata TaxID=110450 RepID=A0A6G1C1Q3_9ORYZ|nr:hypothetical protein E2562_001885 [Oryza meyeriana var. granulata]